MSDEKKKTDAELLEIASQKVAFKPIKKVNKKLTQKARNKIDFQEFIKDMRLKPGYYSIQRHKLYLAYTRWSDTPMSFKSFGRFATDFFATHGQHQRKLYYISLNNFTLQSKAVRKKRERNEISTEEEKDYEEIETEIPSVSEGSKPKGSSGDN